MYLVQGESDHPCTMCSDRTDNQNPYILSTTNLKKNIFNLKKHLKMASCCGGGGGSVLDIFIRFGRAIPHSKGLGTLTILLKKFRIIVI